MEVDEDMEPTFDEGEGLAFETSKGISVLKKFSDMGLRPQVLRGLYQYGFEKPSAIQQRAIVPIAAGRDIIAQAQSGSPPASLLTPSLTSKHLSPAEFLDAFPHRPSMELSCISMAAGQSTSAF